MRPISLAALLFVMAMPCGAFAQGKGSSGLESGTTLDRKATTENVDLTGWTEYLVKTPYGTWAQTGILLPPLPVSLCKDMPAKLKKLFSSFDQLFERDLDGFGPSSFAVCYDRPSDAVLIYFNYDLALEQKLQQAREATGRLQPGAVYMGFFTGYVPGSAELVLGMVGPKTYLHPFAARYAAAFQRSGLDYGEGSQIFDRTGYVVRVINDKGESVVTTFQLGTGRSGPPPLVPVRAVVVQRRYLFEKRARPPETLTLGMRDYVLIAGHRYDLAHRPTEANFLFTFFGH